MLRLISAMAFGLTIYAGTERTGLAVGLQPIARSPRIIATIRVIAWLWIVLALSASIPFAELPSFIAFLPHPPKYPQITQYPPQLVHCLSTACGELGDKVVDKGVGGGLVGDYTECVGQSVEVWGSVKDIPTICHRQRRSWCF